MPWFRFTIHGKNYVLNVDGKPLEMGFFTTRFVRAKCVDKAEQHVMKVIRNDKVLNGMIIRNATHTPTFELEEVVELLNGRPPNVGRWSFRKKTGKGFTFYPMNEAESER